MQENYMLATVVANQEPDLESVDNVCVEVLCGYVVFENFFQEHSGQVVLQ
jgi:hypothetical protein